MSRFLFMSLSLKVLLCVHFMCTTLSKSRSHDTSSSCDLEIRQSFDDYGYYEDGDIIIGGVLTAHSSTKDIQLTEKPVKHIMCMAPTTYLYIKFLIFIFTIQTINSNIDILPNITLGYHIIDTCLDTRKAVKSVLQILSGPGKTVPNYSCKNNGKLSGFVGDHFSSTTIPVAQILGVYGYTQISYGATDFSLSDRRIYSYFFRTVQNNHVYYFIISKLIKHFGWTWVGIIATNEDDGEEERVTFSNYLRNDGICVAYTIKWNMRRDNQNIKIKEIVRKSSAKVIVLCGSYSLAVAATLRELEDVFHDKTLILPPSWAVTNVQIESKLVAFNRSLALELLPTFIPGLDNFIDNLHPAKFPKDVILKDLWVLMYRCLSENAMKNTLFQKLYRISLRNCTVKYKLPYIKSYMYVGCSKQVNSAVRAVAHALHNMISGFNEQSNKKKKYIHNFRNQLHHYIKKLTTSSANYFDENGEYVQSFILFNWIFHRNDTRVHPVGNYTSWAPKDQKLHINSKNIIWKTGSNEIPKSQCSDNCLPGQRKVPVSGIHSCCFHCVQCSEGEISNMTDSENCIICSEYEWPNEKKDRCIPKLEEFLAYTDDVLTIILASISVLLCLTTITIIIVFILFWDTPIVKANNRTLSFVLLVSILLSFLCVFLFLGLPGDITCMLRQTSFGIIFSIAVSSVLAKTIMVYVVFKATKPGTAWKKWVNVKLSNYIVLFFSIVQVIISVCWLAISPPFQEMDTHSYLGRIIIQCNEGSVIAFYSLLGYMGFLAAVSFVIAFLVRTLPDSFNEAKYITFSMLVFCSVWIAMIPAYLSTKGKYMVAVEVFAILTSSAGLLGCIFIPKCYIIMFKPEINTREHILREP